jgi:hypothetical protein
MRVQVPAAAAPVQLCTRCCRLCAVRPLLRWDHSETGAHAATCMHSLVAGNHHACTHRGSDAITQKRSTQPPAGTCLCGARPGPGCSCSTPRCCAARALVTLCSKHAHTCNHSCSNHTARMIKRCSCSCACARAHVDRHTCQLQLHMHASPCMWLHARGGGITAPHKRANSIAAAALPMTGSRKHASNAPHAAGRHRQLQRVAGKGDAPLASGVMPCSMLCG